MRIILNDLTKNFYFLFDFRNFYHFDTILYGPYRMGHTVCHKIRISAPELSRSRKSYKRSDPDSVNESFASACMNFESTASMFAQHDIADHSHWSWTQHEIQRAIAVDTVFDVTIACWDGKFSFQRINDSKCQNGTCDKFHFSVLGRDLMSMLFAGNSDVIQVEVVPKFQ